MTGKELSSGDLPREWKQVSLKEWNTLGVEATAQRLYRVTSREELSSLYSASLLSEQTLILGGGSNVLLLDPLPEPVVRMEISTLELVPAGDRDVLIRAGAGVHWHELVVRAVKEGLGGVEQLALIPGTVGAAPVQNIGAYGVELSDRLESVEALDLKEGRWCTFSPEECRFGYRDSLFKNEGKGRYVIANVTLRLQRKGYRPVVAYQALTDHLIAAGITEPTIQQVFDAVVAIRRSKLPDPSRTSNAGSFFKNPVISRETLEALQQSEGEVPFYPLSRTEVKVPAAWLIDRSGLKGVRRGDVGTWPGQPLVVVNHGAAASDEILAFSEWIREEVARRFDIELEREVTLVTRDAS